MSQVPAAPFNPLEVPMFAWQLSMSHLATVHVAASRGLCKMLKQLEVPCIQLKFCSDKFGMFDPSPSLLPACLPITKYKQLRLDSQRVSADSVAEFACSSSFLTDAYWGDVSELELKGSLWTALLMLAHLQSNRVIKQLQKGVFVTDARTAGCGADVRGLLKLVQKFPNLCCVVIDSSSMRLEDLNIFNNNKRLVDITAIRVILSGSPLCLQNVRRLCLGVNLDSEAISDTSLLNNQSFPEMISFSVAHINSTSLIFDQIMRGKECTGSSMEQRNTRVNKLVQHILQLPCKLKSLSVDVILNKVTLAAIASRSSIQCLSVQRLEPEDVAPSRLPNEAPPVLSSLRELTCSLLHLEQLDLITPNITFLKFDQMTSLQHHAQVPLAEQQLQPQGNPAAQPEQQLRAVYDLPSTIHSLSTLDTMLDLGRNTQSFSNTTNMYLQIQKPHATHTVAVPRSSAALSRLLSLTLDGSAGAKQVVLSRFLNSLQRAPVLDELVLNSWVITSRMADRLNLLEQVTRLKLVQCVVSSSVAQEIVTGMVNLVRFDLELCHGVTKQECQAILLRHNGGVNFRISCRDWAPLFQTNV